MGNTRSRVLQKTSTEGNCEEKGTTSKTPKTKSKPQTEERVPHPTLPDPKEAQPTTFRLKLLHTGDVNTITDETSSILAGDHAPQSHRDDPGGDIDDPGSGPEVAPPVLGAPSVTAPLPPSRIHIECKVKI